MAGIAGLGAVVGRCRSCRGSGWATRGRGGRSPSPARRSGCRSSPSPWRPGSGRALLALAAVGAAGLVFQTTTQSQMLALSDIDYHGRMQSMVVLGFSGFGLAALPLGLLADAVTLEVTLAAMGVVVLAVTGAVRAQAGPAPSPARRRRVRLSYAFQSTPVNVATQCSAMRSPVDALHDQPRDDGALAGLPVDALARRPRPHPVAGDGTVVDPRLDARQHALELGEATLVGGPADRLAARAGVADEGLGEDLVDGVEAARRARPRPTSAGSPPASSSGLPTVGESRNTRAVLRKRRIGPVRKDRRGICQAG